MTLLIDAKGDLTEHCETLEVEGVRYLLKPVQYVSDNEHLDSIYKMAESYRTDSC